jgi:hypothetical protein
VADYVPRARAAFYSLLRLWTAESAAAEVAAARLLAPPSSDFHAANCSTATTGSCDLTGPRLRRVPGSLALTLDCQPYLMRGIAYSPAPFGHDPGYGEPYGDYFTSEYASIFVRDLALAAAIGVNTVRLYSFKTSIRHTTFFDACIAHNISALVAFDMGGAAKTPLASPSARIQTKARLRRQMSAAVDRRDGTGRPHRAIIMWLIGNEENGAWHMYVCDDEYAAAFLQPTYGVSRCQFGSDGAHMPRDARPPPCTHPSICAPRPLLAPTRAPTPPSARPERPKGPPPLLPCAIACALRSRGLPSRYRRALPRGRGHGGMRL